MFYKPPLAINKYTPVYLKVAIILLHWSTKCWFWDKLLILKEVLLIVLYQLFLHLMLEVYLTNIFCMKKSIKALLTKKFLSRHKDFVFWLCNWVKWTMMGNKTTVVIQENGMKKKDTVIAKMEDICWIVVLMTLNLTPLIFWNSKLTRDWESYKT